VKFSKKLIELSFVVLCTALLVGCLSGTNKDGGDGEGDGGDGSASTSASSSTAAATSSTATAPTLTSITVTGPASAVSACQPQQFVATGIYSDNTTQDLSTSVVWSVDVASSGVALAGSSTIVGIGVGSAKITATDTMGAITGSTTMNVASGVLSSIAVTPATATLAIHQVQSFVAQATCTTGTPTDISKGASWAVGNIGLAGVSSDGRVAGMSAGSTTVSATVGSITGSAVFTVQ